MEIMLEAPTQGWLAVGFSHENTLVGADLKMAAVQNGELILSDQHIVGMGDHRVDEALGGRNEMKAIHFEQTNAKTQVRFQIPLRTGEKTDFQHTLGQKCWVILAWSVSPDFDHHSRERNHLQVQF